MREFPRLRHPSTARGPGRCAEPDRGPGARHAKFARATARRTAKDRSAAARPRQIAGREMHRNGKIAATLAQQGGTEFFTMFGTMMDNKPLSPSSAEPDPQLAADDAKPAVSPFSPASLPSSPPSSASTTGARRKSPLRDFFVGPDGIYAVPRWLTYLAIAFVVFQLEVWLLSSLRPHLSDLSWRMMIEARM